MGAVGTRGIAGTALGFPLLDPIVAPVGAVLLITDAAVVHTK